MENVLYELDGHVATITYNRPDALNAINGAMRRDLNEAFARFRDEDEAWIAIVTGAGRAFCAGADLTEFGTAPSPTIGRRVRFARDVWALLARLPVRSVAGGKVLAPYAPLPSPIAP